MHKIRAKMTMPEASEFLGISVPSVHKRLRARNLSEKLRKSGSRVYFGFDVSRELLDIKWKPLTLAWQVVKGGTGKTTLAHEVACCAHAHGSRVLAVDLDQQGNLTTTFGFDMLKAKPMLDIVREEVKIQDAIFEINPGLDLLASNMKNAKLDYHITLEHLPLISLYKSVLDPIRSSYDLIIIDCPPALGASVCAAALAADVVVMPIEPDELSLSGLDISLGELDALEQKHECKIDRAIVLNKFSNRTILAGEVLHALVGDPELQPLLVPTHVRDSQDFPNAMAQHDSIYSTLRKCPAKEDITTLSRDLLGLSKRHKLRRND